MGEATPTDMDLVGRACAGETDAFAELVGRYQDYIYSAVAHMVGIPSDAEDIAQEVFLKAFRGLKGFRQEAEFSTWLYGIMLNCVRTHWRRRARRRDTVSLDAGHGESGNPHEPASNSDGPAEESVRAETIVLVREAIGTLDRQLREVIVMRDIQGLSYGQLAQALGLPLGTVKSRLFRARCVLKDKISPALAADL